MDDGRLDEEPQASATLRTGGVEQAAPFSFDTVGDFFCDRLPPG